MGTDASLLESRASEFFTLDTQSRCSFSDRNELTLAGGFALAGKTDRNPAATARVWRTHTLGAARPPEVSVHHPDAAHAPVAVTLGLYVPG